MFDNVTATNLTSIVVPLGKLSYSTIYWWHVRYQDNNGAWSEYSTETWFNTTANQLPNQPVNSLPVNGAPGQALTATLQSLGFTDPDPGDTHAASQWQIRTSAGDYTTGLVYDSGTDNTSLTSIAVPSGRLSYSTTYYWHVRYQDNNLGWSVYSAEFSFTTSANQAPYPPKNSLPVNLATDVSLTPTLQSSAFNDPGDTHAASQWQITTVAGYYATTVFDNVTYVPNLTSTVVPSGLLSYSTTYYWRVKHQDSQLVWSAWSSETSFTTRPPGPGADFSADVTVVTVGQAARFTDTSTGAIISWTWDFGDGTTPLTWNYRPNDRKVSHTYAVAGIYTVALKITDSEGKSYTETKTAYIHVYELPHADFSAGATGVLLGEAVAFTNLSTDGIPPLTYAWDFDGDGTVDSTDLNPTHSYAATGTYTVSLKVTDARGNSTTEKRNGYISVGNAIAPHNIPPQGGIIQTADGQIAITFPADAVDGEAVASIEKVSPPDAAKAPGGFRMGNTCFTLGVVDAEGKEIIMFSQWVTVTVKYSDEDVAAAGGTLENLVLAYYNEATGKWMIVETTLNSTDRSLSATTTHFSTWAILVKTSSRGTALWIQIVIGIAAVLGVAIVIWKLISVKQPDQVP